MHPLLRADRRDGRAQAGQVLVITALLLMAIVGGVAIVVDGGNAFAQQRSAQNATDAAAEAGATVIGEYLGKVSKTEADVYTAITTMATKDGLDSVTGYYTDWQGHPLDASGVVTTPGSAAQLNGGILPVRVQGVHVDGHKTFDTYFARAVGVTQYTANTGATAVAGRLTGGVFLPVVFPINITDCEGNGSLGAGQDTWQLSQPGNPPTGQEYIVPLCKTGGGNFMILDLDPNLSCQQEVLTPPAVQWNLPTWVPADNGNDCAKKIAEAMGNWHGKVVTVPVCDSSPDQACNQEGSGSNASYHIVKVASFYVDYMSYQNNGTNGLCSPHDGLVPIAGNGSSSCIAGWFVRYITAGPVGEGDIGNSDAVGVQLIQ